MNPGTEGGHRRKGTQWVLSSMEVLLYQPAACVSSTSSSREPPSLSLQTISIGSFRIDVTETVPVLNPSTRRAGHVRVNPITKPQPKNPVKSTSQTSQSNRKTPVKSTGRCKPLAEGVMVQSVSRNCFETQSMCVTFFEKNIGNVSYSRHSHTMSFQSNLPIQSLCQTFPSNLNLNLTLI